MPKSRQVTFQYEPRPQFAAFHQRSERWACMVCHRRAGKTVSCVNELVIRASYTKKQNARFSYVAPTYAQAKDVAWTYLKDATRAFAADIRESELRVILPNGAYITLYGSDNQDRLRGIYHDGIIMDEFGDCRPSLWGEVILPSLLDRDGWAVFIGTPKGKNHFYHTYERAKRESDWFDLSLRADTSGIFTPEQLDIAYREYEGREEEWEQEMLCSFTAAIKGTYYADMVAKLEDAGQIKAQTLYDPDQPVNVATDLGFSDSTAMWFWQARPDGIALVDYYEAAGKNLQHYFEMLQAKKYAYDTIWLPHDARAKTLQTGRSTVEQFLEEKLPVRIAPRLSIQHGIDAVRKILPRCYFDTQTCYTGVENLRAYRRKFDDFNQVFLNKPLHDFASDGADAFRYLALVAQIDGKAFTPAKAAPTYSPPPTIEPVTLDGLYADREKGKTLIQKLRI